MSPSLLPLLHCHSTFPLCKTSNFHLSRTMKIFNWVHRRFNNKAGNVKKSDDIAGEDHQFPVENNCNHVFERWRGGILAIGTLGYDPLKDENQQINDYLYHDVVFSQGDCGVDETNDEEEGEEEVESNEEEENPLVVGEAEEVTETEMEENWSHEFEYVMVKKKERTTLADLFYADSHDQHVVVKKKHSTNNAESMMKEKPNRKHIAKDAHARPIHKFNRLMRRILKRKIHPDVGPLNPKVAAVNSKTRTPDDYASLLPTQDAKK